MLSYGLTSTLSVADPLHQSVEMREVLECGNLIGPRLFVAPPLWEGNRLFYQFARTLRTPEIADIEIAKAKTMGVDYMKSYVRAPIPIMSRIAQGALDLGVQSGTYMIQPGRRRGLAAPPICRPRSAWVQYVMKTVTCSRRRKFSRRSAPRKRLPRASVHWKATQSYAPKTHMPVKTTAATRISRAAVPTPASSAPGRGSTGRPALAAPGEAGQTSGSGSWRSWPG